MPTVEVTSVTVSHIWDDKTKSDTEVEKGTFDDTGPYVAVREDDGSIYFRPESWPEIRGQIQSMFDSMSDD